MGFIPQFRSVFDEEDSKAVAAVLASGWVGEGPKTKEFEEKVAVVMGYRYGVAVCNGTVALSLALMAAGIQPHDIVSIPALTFIATADAVKACGAEIVFQDVDRKTFCANSGSVDIPVALNGRSVSGGIVIDAAQALGSKIGKSDMATLSFHPSKIITTAGGGMVLMDSKELRDKVHRLKDFGRLDKADHHPEVGFNYKFTDLQAALGLAQLKKLPKRLEHKRHICTIYQEELRGFGICGQDYGEVREDYGEILLWQDILVKNRDLVVARLEKQGVGTRPFYKPLHTQPAYRMDKVFPVVERVSSMGFWLPSSSDLMDEEISFICEKVKEAVA